MTSCADDAVLPPTPPVYNVLAMKIALGADHAGFELKEKIKQQLAAEGITVDDRGTNSTASVDYPDYARAVAEEVAAKGADLGILVCSTGIGMSIAANKVPGIRAAKVDTEFEAETLARAQRRQRAGAGGRHR